MKVPGWKVWWPFAVALQGEAANHREVRRSRAGVLSVAEKARREDLAALLSEMKAENSASGVDHEGERKRYR